MHVPFVHTSFSSVTWVSGWKREDALNLLKESFPSHTRRRRRRRRKMSYAWACFFLSLFSVVFEFDSSCFCLRSFFLAVLQHHDHEPPSFTSICLRSLNLEFSFAKLFEKKRLVEGRASSSIALNFPALLLLRSKQNLSITWKKRYPFLRSWTLVSSWTCRSCKEIPWDKQSPFNSQGSIWELFFYRFCYAVCCARTRLRLDLTSSVLRELWRDFSFDSWLACLFSSE